MVHNVIILGTGAAGLTAAIYAARANLKPVVVEGMEPSGQLTITTDVENFPGFADPIAGPELMDTMRKQAERFDVEFIRGKAEAVDLSKQPFEITVADQKETLKTKTLIVSTGASARWLGIPSEKKLYNKGVSACATCDGFFYRGKEVMIVGGGDTAMEEALFLANLASKVTIVHRRDELRASPIMGDRAKKHPKIEIAWDSVIDEILGEDAVTGVRLKNVKTNELTEIACEGVFIAIGHTPNTDFLKGQLETDENGYVVTKKSSMATSVPGVFAAGDVQDSVYRQAISAAGTGCMAAIDAERYIESIG